MWAAKVFCNLSSKIGKIVKKYEKIIDLLTYRC